MSRHDTAPATSSDAARTTAQDFRSLLVPVDLSPASDRIIGRVAQLPLAPGARVALLHVIPDLLPARAQIRAEADAAKALAADAATLQATVPNGVKVETIVAVGSPADEITRHAENLHAELVVMGRGGGRALRDIFLGSTAERVTRRAQLPVLVVRLSPRKRYHRPALALDLDQAAHGILELLLRIVPAPRPAITVIHAYDIPYHGLIYPSLSEDDAEEYRIEYREEATRKLGEFLVNSFARANVANTDLPSWKPHVRFGSSRSVIERAVKKGEVDLLILGTHGYTGIANAFLGTVAGDVLREVACDVLVVPPRQDVPEKT